MSARAGRSTGILTYMPLLGSSLSGLDAAECQDERQANQNERGYSDCPPKGQRDDPADRKHDQCPPVNELRQDDDKDGNTYCPEQFQDGIIRPEIPRLPGQDFTAYPAAL